MGSGGDCGAGGGAVGWSMSETGCSHLGEIKRGGRIPMEPARRGWGRNQVALPLDEISGCGGPGVCGGGGRVGGRGRLRLCVWVARTPPPWEVCGKHRKRGELSMRPARPVWRRKPTNGGWAKWRFDTRSTIICSGGKFQYRFPVLTLTKTSNNFFVAGCVCVCMKLGPRTMGYASSISAHTNLSPPPSLTHKPAYTHPRSLTHMHAHTDARAHTHARAHAHLAVTLRLSK